MDHARELGLLIGKGGLYGNVIRIAPPLSISETEVVELLTKMTQAMLLVR